MDSQQFARKISTALQWTPVPVEPDSGEVPDDYKVVEEAGRVEIIYTRSFSIFGRCIVQRASFSVQERSGVWTVADGVKSSKIEYRMWFPALARESQPGDEFDPQSLLQFYRVSQ